MGQSAIASDGAAAHTIILVVGLLPVCQRLAILLLGNIIRLAILNRLALSFVGGSGLVAVLSHDGCRLGLGARCGFGSGRRRGELRQLTPGKAGEGSSWSQRGNEIASEYMLCPRAIGNWERMVCSDVDVGAGSFVVCQPAA